MDTSTLYTIFQYLLKGGLLTAASTYFGDIRTYVRAGLWQSVVQVLVFAGLLFLIDYILPRFFPDPQAPTPAQSLVNRVQQLLSGSQAPTPAQNLVNRVQQGGDCEYRRF